MNNRGWSNKFIEILRRRANLAMLAARKWNLL